jgi:flagellar biosynthesis anti-sigma factor FlgM
MMCQEVFPVINTFNRQLRRHWRDEPYHPVSRSRSGMDVHRTRTARRCQRSEQVLAPDLQTRADKVAQLRRAVANGDYCVSPEKIAEKMVQEALAAMFTS